jgi:hypothetical protein
MAKETTHTTPEKPEDNSSSHIEEQILIANDRRIAFQAANLYRANAEWEPGEQEAFEQELAVSSTIMDRFGVFLRYLDKLQSLNLAATTELIDELEDPRHLSADDIVSMIDPELFIEFRDQYRELRQWIWDNDLAEEWELEREDSGLTVHFNYPEDEKDENAMVGYRNRPLIKFVITDEKGIPTLITIAKRMVFLIDADDHERIVGSNGTCGAVPEIEDLLDSMREDVLDLPKDVWRNDAIILPVSTEYYVSAKPLQTQ